jgi:DNA-binding transcriptional MerR regulator
MKIGELSVSSSTPVETIRFYEREGLLPASPLWGQKANPRYQRSALTLR